MEKLAEVGNLLGASLIVQSQDEGLDEHLSGSGSFYMNALFMDHVMDVMLNGSERFIGTGCRVIVGSMKWTEKSV